MKTRLLLVIKHGSNKSCPSEKTATTTTNHHRDDFVAALLKVLQSLGKVRQLVCSNFRKCCSFPRLSPETLFYHLNGFSRNCQNLWLIHVKTMEKSFSKQPPPSQTALCGLYSRWIRATDSKDFGGWSHAVWLTSSASDATNASVFTN